MKVSDFDARKHWIEIISLDRYNRLLQNDVLKNLFKFWKSTKDFAPSTVWGLESYSMQEMEARRYLALVTGQNPSKMDQGQAAHHRNISANPGDVTGQSGAPEMERLDSESRLMSDNDSMNVGKSAAGTMNEVSSKHVPHIDMDNVSMQEDLPLSSDERNNLSDSNRGNQMSEPGTDLAIPDVVA